MARNEEKAQSMLSRFLAAKNDEKKKPKEKRPYLASECRDLADADKWRNQILREIGRKVMDIQNPGLGEHRIRDLNDEINKLIREKGHWEARILELGGPNYAKIAPKVVGEDGKEVDIASGKGLGYKYFGAAKQLPGVKELFELPPEIRKKRNRYEMYKRIDMDYYGFRDDEDGVLENLERDAEKEMRAKAIEEWERIEAVKAEARKGVKEVVVMRSETDDMVDSDLEDEVDEDEEERQPKRFEFVAHVPLPDEKEIERMVVEKKKQELLSKYASEDLVKEEREAKEMLNIHSDGVWSGRTRQRRQRWRSLLVMGQQGQRRRQLPRAPELVVSEDIWFNAPRKGVLVFALPGERCVADISGDFKILFSDRHGDFYCWLNTNMMETRQILETSELDGFEKRRLPSPGLQVEVVILDHDAPIPRKRAAEGTGSPNCMLHRK